MPLLFLVASFAIEPPTVVAQKVKDENGSRRFYPDDPLWQDPDSMDIAPVKEFDLYFEYDFLENTFGDPAQFDGPAVNVNTLDEVPDSSWFTNRLGRGDMTIEELVRGPDTVEGPAPGVWQVTGRPSAGITPKFTIRHVPDQARSDPHGGAALRRGDHLHEDFSRHRLPRARELPGQHRYVAARGRAGGTIPLRYW